MPLIDQLCDHIPSIREGYGPHPVETVLEQHEVLVAAVDSGDAEVAREAMAKHLAYLREVLEALAHPSR